MKRKALLICNNGAGGATHDIDKWQNFLLSGEGGVWERTEISLCVNPSRIELLKAINIIKASGFDFVLVAFAGHGEWKRSTILEINPSGESISESEFNNLAPREIVCLDCCRGISRIAESATEVQLRMFSANQKAYLRQIYDSRMMQAVPQIVKLYACQVGESAYGDNDGGFYTNNLIDKASDFLPNTNFQTVVRAHNLASTLTTNETWIKVGEPQHPDIVEARCAAQNQLIIGINAGIYRL